MKKKDIFFPLLCCPSCHSNLFRTPKGFSCKRCSLLYPIVKGIPVFTGSTIEMQVEKQQKIFNATYKTLQRYTLHNWQKSFVNRLLTSFNITKNKNTFTNRYYLDVGAGGAGYTVIELAKQGLYSVGIDISFKGMQKAKKFAQAEGVADKCFFLVCDAEKMPFKKGAFHYVSCIMLLEHLLHDKIAVKEISRITKKYGKIFISVPNTYLLMWPFLWPVYWVWDKKLGHMRHYTEKRLVSLFAECNVKKKEIFYTVHLVKFVQLICDITLPGKFKQKAWWWFENIDFAQKRIKTGLNLNGIFEK